MWASPIWARASTGLFRQTGSDMPVLSPLTTRPRTHISNYILTRAEQSLIHCWGPPSSLMRPRVKHIKIDQARSLAQRVTYTPGLRSRDQLLGSFAQDSRAD